MYQSNQDFTTSNTILTLLIIFFTMENSHVISALKSKRAELMGKANYHEKELRTLIDSINHVNKSLKLFDPNIKLSAIRPKIFRKYNKLFRSGELSRLILEIFRDLNSQLTCEQVSEEIKKRKSLNQHVKDLNSSVRRSLYHHERKGLLKRIVKEFELNQWELINE